MSFVPVSYTHLDVYKRQVVSYEKLGDWDNAKEKVSEYNEQYPGDSKAEKEAEFLETR